MCILIFPTNFVRNISDSKKKRARYVEVYIGLHVKYPLSLSDFIETWIFPKRLRRMLKYHISWKSFRWDPIFFIQTGGRTDRRRTDMTKLIIACRNFANAPEKWYNL